jgi:hypothetical protein
MTNIEEFKKELISLVNKYSIENRSNTPDYLIADYLFHCLLAFETATNRRDKWYGDEKKYVRQQDRIEDDDVPSVYNACAGYYEKVRDVDKFMDLVELLASKGYLK